MYGYYSTICPHCAYSINIQFQQLLIGEDDKGIRVVTFGKCSQCEQLIIYMQLGQSYAPQRNAGQTPSQFDPTIIRLIYPKFTGRPPVSEAIPKEFADEYQEACMVLADSPRASAALSRHCLQRLLRDVVHVKPGDLNKEIDALLAKKELPPVLANSVDGIRHIGNFAAHPNKYLNSSEIITVEPGEAEWCLDILEGLFNFYFVLQSDWQKRIEAVNKKLEASGKDVRVKSSN
ncbi:MAG TPA: DUF4145 domain-containing protein [Anaerolineales bacterium]|jgi:hypothetical protein